MDELLDYFQNRQSEIIRLIHEAVEIESPSYDVAGSKNIVGWFEDQAAAIPCVSKIERIFAENYGEHLLIRAFEEIPHSPVLLLGHTDTVHPRNTKLQNPTRIDGDKFYGCGIFDMKANAVLMLEILRAFSEFAFQPQLPVNILLSCDEEIGSHSGREIVEREALKAAFCYVLEPSSHGRCKTARKGTSNYTLKTHGLPAHAGLEPEKGASAILEISRQIQKIQELNAPEDGTTVNVCTISGGTASNVIPAEAECSIDVRFTKLSEAERINAELNQLGSFDNRVKIELLGEINRPPMERTEAVVKLYKNAQNVADAMSYAFGETQVGGASDGNFVGALGIPVLDGLGIAGDNAHRLDEFIYVSDIAKRATLIAKLLYGNQPSATV
jgi:glutamate carboxypeptidase